MLVRVVLFALSLVATVAWADDVHVDVHGADGWLLVGARTDALLDDGVERSLRSGLPARVAVDVELYAARDAFWDRLRERARFEVRVLFDLLDERYDVIDETGALLLRTTDVDSMKGWVQRFEGFPLVALEDLDDDTCYVVVSMRVEPLSVDEVRDLERWLQGNLREGEGLLGRLSTQVLGMLKGRVGLGDRRVDGRTSEFRATRFADHGAPDPGRP